MPLQTKLLVLTITTVACLMPGCADSLAHKPSRPLLIEFGQTTPDPTLMRQYVDYWEEYLPFDGVVFTINQNRYAGRYGGTSANVLDPSHWTLDSGVFANKKLHLKDYNRAITDLKATKFKKFQHNFISVNCHPKMHFALNWFDDQHWANVLNNIGIVAAIARQGRCAGIVLDTEIYGHTQIWTYTQLKQTFPDGPQDWPTCRQKVYQRGREFIQAINAEFPGCQIPLLFGSCLTHDRLARAAGFDDLAQYRPNSDVDFSSAREALISPFIDGMIAAADRNTKIIDWYELSYYYKTEPQFAQVAAIVRENCSAYSLFPDAYRTNIQMGLGLYPTHRPIPGRTFTPDELARSVEYALKHTETHVWVWNEAKTFWVKGGPQGKPQSPQRPMVNYENPDPGHLTAPVTPDNMLAPKYQGVPTQFIDAITAGKTAALK